MTPQERRGRRLFVAVVLFVAAEKLLGVGLALSGGRADVRWFQSVVKPLAIAVGTATFGWHGDTWLRRLAGAAFVFYGSMLALVTGRVLLHLAEATPPQATGVFLQVAGLPVGLMLLIGLLYVAAGLVFLLSPSLRAFFRYQREGPAGEPRPPLDEPL